MKDLVISACRVKFELWSLFACFVLANVVNIYSIISFKSNWGELLSMWYVVLALSVAFYVAFAIVRLLIMVIKRVVKR